MDIRDIEIGDIFMEILEFDDLRGIVREIFLVRYFCVLCFSTPILVAANIGANPKFLQIHQSTYHKILSKCKNEEKEVPKFSTPSQTHKFTVVSQIMR